MRGILAPIVGGLRRCVSAGKAAVGEHSPPDHPPHIPRRLAESIDQAMALGHWDRAERLAETAARLAPRHASVRERLARLRLAQGDPETALSIIDTPWSNRALPASLRLLRAACLLLTGAKAEAHIDLHRWCEKATAPLDARVLLGLLEWQRGDDAAAIQTLQRNLKHLEDPRTLQALLLISVLRDRPQQTEMWAQRLRHTGCPATCGPDVDVLLTSLGLSGVRPDAEPTPHQVDALAMELITFELAIGTVVEAQRRRPHLATVRLLYKALEQAIGDLCDPPAAMHGLARLSMLLGDRAAARRWAQRGLAQNPMSVPLTLLLGELPEQTPEALAPDAPDVLASIGRTARLAKPRRDQEKAA